MDNFELGKKIINAVNHKDKAFLLQELAAITGEELIMLLHNGYKFLIADIFKILEKRDAEPERELEANAKPTSLCPVADSERDAGIRTLSLPAGSCTVGSE